MERVQPMSDRDFEAAVKHICETGLGLPAPLRFDVGALVMCNLGPDGWKLGRVVALHYREDHWATDQVAPYQVALEGDHSLIYVPHEDPRFCREATQEDLNIERRLDTLAPPPPGLSGSGQREVEEGAGRNLLRRRGPAPAHSETETERWRHSVSGYRDGRCHGCGCSPECWSSVELYSEHYRAAARNGLTITRRAVELGTLRVGAPVHHAALRHAEGWPASGFMQCPTLPRLPPGLTWTDDGVLSGSPRFDPYRPASYRVDFVAVSAAEWEDARVGLVRLEISFRIEGNTPPKSFDALAFRREQQLAHAAADRLLHALAAAWERWERQDAGNRETIDQMCAHLTELRDLLERQPRLGGGFYFAQLGGFYMNVHKLLENTLFECELYLGQALLFGEAEVRRIAEQNLEGCYQKRLLEAARFLWLDGIAQMMRGEWAAAAETLRLAADKKDGWGWGVNNGDIWIAESAARLVLLAELEPDADVTQPLADVARLLERGAARAAEGHYCGPEGHPWANEIRTALAEYGGVRGDGADAAAWLDALKKRALFWCAHALGGSPPFPPKPRPRLQDAAALKQRLPGHNK